MYLLRNYSPISPVQTLKQAGWNCSRFIGVRRLEDCYLYVPPCHGLNAKRHEHIGETARRLGCSPYHPSIGCQHALCKWGTVMGTPSTSSMNLVAQAREQHFALAFEIDLFPGSFVSKYWYQYRSHDAHISPSLSSDSSRTAMVLVDMVR